MPSLDGYPISWSAWWRMTQRTALTRIRIQRRSVFEIKVAEGREESKECDGQKEERGNLRHLNVGLVAFVGVLGVVFGAVVGIVVVININILFIIVAMIPMPLLAKIVMGACFCLLFVCLFQDHLFCA